jgi:hypothetical protein
MSAIFMPSEGMPAALAVGGEIALAQAEIDVLAANAAQQLLREVQFFQRRMRAEQATDRRAAMSLGHVAQACAA